MTEREGECLGKVQHFLVLLKCYFFLTFPEECGKVFRVNNSQ